MAPLVSSVLMNVVPAQVAGVGSIALVHETLSAETSDLAEFGDVARRIVLKYLPKFASGELRGTALPSGRLLWRVPRAHALGRVSRCHGDDGPLLGLQMAGIGRRG